MEAGFIILLAAIAVVCFVVGLLIGRREIKRLYARDTRYTQGVLNIDCSDPEFEPGLFLGLAAPVRDVITQKYVTFDVNVMTPDSRK